MRSLIAGMLVCLQVYEGAVIGVEIVKVKEGDTLDKLVDISEMKPVHIRVLHKCEKWKTVFLYCSHGEEKKGCLNRTSPRISVQIADEKVSISLHNVTASDSGFYIFDAHGDQGMEAKTKRFQVVVEPLEVNIIAKPPPPAPTDTSNNHIPLAVYILPAFCLFLFCFPIYFYKQKIRILCQKALEQHHNSSVQSSDCEDEASDDPITTDDKETAMNLKSLLLSGRTNP